MVKAVKTDFYSGLFQKEERDLPEELGSRLNTTRREWGCIAKEKSERVT